MIKKIIEKEYFTYLISNKWITVFYTGSTDHLIRRVWQHKHGLIDNAFTKKYNINKLLYYEKYLTRKDAYNREKEIKGWTRNKKIKLIKKMNPDMRDLSDDWWHGKL